jgi:hypothetical protein
MTRRAAIVVALICASGFGEAIALAQRGEVAEPVEVAGKLVSGARARAESVRPTYRRPTWDNQRPTEVGGGRTSGRQPHSEELYWRPTLPLEPGTPPLTAEPVFNPKVVTVIPEEPVGFRNVFGRPDREGQLGDIRDLGRSLTPKNGKNLGGVGVDVDAVRASFREARAQGHDTVILVGHSTGRPGQERSLPLPGGDRVGVDQLHKMAAEEGVNLRLVTCFGRDFGVQEQLSLGNALRLVQQGIQSVEVIPDVPAGGGSSGAGAADTTGHAGAGLSTWDTRVIGDQKRLGLSDVVIYGSVHDGRSGLRIWESACRRPFWLGATAWLLLAGGLAANALVMRWQRRQMVGGYESLDAMEAGVAEVLSATDRHRRAMRLGVPLTLGLAVLAAMLIRLDRWHGAVLGRESSAWFVNVPAALGVVVMLVAALAARVQAGRSGLGRVVLGLSGAIAGGVYAALVGAAVVGGLGLVPLLVINLLHVIACFFNGFARFPRMAIPTVLWWSVITAGAAGLAVLYGVYQGALAGFHDLPLLLALRNGAGRLVVRDAGAPQYTYGHVTPAGRAGGALGSAAAIALGSFSVGLVAYGTFSGVISLYQFVRDDPSFTPDDANRLAIAAAGVLTVMSLFFFGVGFVLSSPKNPAPETGAPVNQSPATLTKLKHETGRVAEAAREAGSAGAVSDTAGLAFGNGSEYLAVATGAPKPSAATGSTGGTTRPRLTLSESLGAAVGLAVLAAFVVGLAINYVYSLVDATPFPAGARVTLVRDAVDREPRFPDMPEIDEIRARMYPPTVQVYHVPSEQTMPLELVERRPSEPGSLLAFPLFPPTPLPPATAGRAKTPPPKDREVPATVEDLGSLTATDLEKAGVSAAATVEHSKKEALDKLAKEVIHAKQREAAADTPARKVVNAREGSSAPDSTRRDRLRGPSGVVFVDRGAAGEGLVYGEVVEGSHAVIVADDQGGKDNRGVLIRLFRDPALGDDPRVEVVVRAANLAKDPSRTGWR